jgi:hypothetical protein
MPNYPIFTRPVVYGVSWTKVASPTLTRTDASVGMVANAGVDGDVVVNNFDTAQIYKDITEVTDAFGNVFVRIPKFWIEKRDSANFKSWRISKKQFCQAAYLPKCFLNGTVELDYVDVGKYNASLDVATSTKLVSFANTYPLINKNIVEFRNYAKANGTGYQQLDIHVVDVIQTLFLVEFATLNSQSIFQGWTNGYFGAGATATVTENTVNRIVVTNAIAANFVVGQAISCGTALGGIQVFYGRTITSITTYDVANKALNFDGVAVNVAIGNIVWSSGWKSGFSNSITAKSGSLVSNSDAKHPCVYRGIENIFGSVWQFVDGVNINNSQAWVCPTPASYASNVFASPYLQLGYINLNSNNYPASMGFDSNYPYAMFPLTSGGSSSQYYCDYYYQTSGQRIALLGGSWYYGTGGGLFYWYLNSSSSGAGIDFSARLLKKAL